MSFEANLFNVLSPLVGGRVFPDDAPLSTLRPYITYQQIGGKVVNYVDDTAPDKKNARVQINVWADTRLAASDASALVETSMRGAAVFNVRPESACVSQREQEANLYGARQDFSIWY